MGNGYAQVVNGPAQRDALLVYLVRPESLVNSCTFEQGISDHRGVLLEAEWEGNYYRTEEERLITVYNKTNIFGQCTFFWESITMGKHW
jgi:hypothetical protein